MMRELDDATAQRIYEMPIEELLENAGISVSLCSLDGTERQVVWAASIRANALRDVAQGIALDLSAWTADDLESIERCVRIMATERPSAKWWIDRRNRNGLDMVQRIEAALAQGRTARGEGIGMAEVRSAQVTTGAARGEGRAPSHDGEYVMVYYRPDGQYIVAGNAGVQWTDDTEADVEDGDLLGEVQAVVRQDRGGPADVEAMGSEERDLMMAAGWLEQQRAAQPGGFFSDRTAAVAATRDGQAVLWSRLSDPMELGSLIPGYRGDGRILYYVGDIEDLRDDDGEVDGDWEEVDPEDYDAE